MFQYGQIVEVRNKNTEPWIRRVFSHINDNNGFGYVVAAPEEVQNIVAGRLPTTFETYGYARAIGIETFEPGQLIRYQISGENRYGIYVEMTNIDRHTIETDAGRIFVEKVWLPTLEDSRLMFPQYQIEEKGQ